MDRSPDYGRVLACTVVESAHCAPLYKSVQWALEQWRYFLGQKWLTLLRLRLEVWYERENG